MFKSPLNHIRIHYTIHSSTFYIIILSQCLVAICANLNIQNNPHTNKQSSNPWTDDVKWDDTIIPVCIYVCHSGTLAIVFSLMKFPVNYIHLPCQQMVCPLVVSIPRHFLTAWRMLWHWPEWNGELLVWLLWPRS